MWGRASRRWFLTGIAACAVASVVTAFGRRPRTKRRQPMRYEDGLAELFTRGGPSFRRMAQAQIAGFGDRLPDWLKSGEQKDVHLNAQPLQQLFAALLTGNAATIEATLVDADVQKLLASRWGRLIAEPSSLEWLDQALGIVIDPLILLGRSD